MKWDRWNERRHAERSRVAPRLGPPTEGAGPAALDTMNVGIVGLGAIGRAVCRALDDGLPGLTVSGATARDREKAERFLKGLRSSVPFLSLDDLIQASDVVVEASTQTHLEEIAPKTLEAGRNLVVLSCGGLLGRHDWVKLAEAKGCRIFVPSAAIAGLDGVKGARVGAITSVTMETRKPPRTGKLSYLSTIALLRDLAAPLRVGT